MGKFSAEFLDGGTDRADRADMEELCITTGIKSLN